MDKITVVLRRAALVFIVCCCSLQWAKAKQYDLPLKFTTYSFESGLPHPDATAVTQDKDGFIWVGTKRGIARYDGYRFYKYSHDPFDTQSLSDNNVNVLLSDHNNQIWVATTDGLNRLSSDNTFFERYYSGQIEGSLSSNSITSLFQDSKNRLWVGTIYGVDRFVESENSFVSHTIASATKNNHITFITENDGLILLGSYSGFYYLNEASGSFEPFTLNNKSSAELFSSGVTASVSISSSTLLVSGNNNLYLVNTKNQSCYQIKPGNQPDAFSDVYINNMTRDNNNLIWISTSKQGMIFYEPLKNSVQQQLYEGNNNRALISNSILSTFQDDSGNMWIVPSSGGLQTWVPITERFGHIYHHIGGKHSILDSRVYSIAEDNNGDLWIGSETGLTYFQRSKGKYTYFKHDPENSQSLSKGAVHAIWNASDHEIWIGTTDGLSYINLANNSIKRFENDEYDPESIGYGSIFSISPKSDNKILLATEFDGLHEFDIKSFKSKKIDLVFGKRVTEGFNTTLSTQTSRFGGEWIRTEAGLIYYERKSGAKFYIEKSSEEQRGLNNKNVSAVYEDDEGGVWVGTLGNGLNYSDNIFSTQRRFKYYDFTNDSYSANVLSILPENDAILWLATTNGLVKFNHKTNKFKHYNRYFGLQHDEFILGSAMRSRSGELFFGGINGISHFNPASLFINSYLPKLYITDVRQSNTSLFNVKGRPITENIILPHTDRNLIINFALLDYAMPRNIRYQFKMEGHNATWIDLGASNEAAFMNLDDGNYLFKVRAKSHEGIWIKNTATLEIDVIPAWWNRWWAYLIYSLFVASVAGIFVEERYKKLAAERREAQAIKSREETMQRVLWGSGDEMWEWDINTGHVRRTHPLPCLGYLNEEDLDTHITAIYDKLHPEEKSAIAAKMKSHLTGKTPYFEGILRVKSLDGQWQWIFTKARVVEHNNDGSAKLLVGTHKDINKIKSTEDQLRLIAKAFENTSDGVSVTDANFINVAVNKAFCQITGYTSEEIIGKPYFFTGLNTNELDAVSEVMHSLNQLGTWRGEIVEQRKNGEKYYIDLNIDDVRDEQGRITHYVSVFSDITFRKKAEEDLMRLANYDSLTKLPNRALLKRRLAQSIKHAKSEDDLIGVLFVDLDDFKTINDSLGHAAGDILLKDVAHRLLNCVGENDIVSRIGGDEFIIVLNYIFSKEEIIQCCSRVMEALKNSFDLGKEHATVSPSIGIGVFPEDGDDADTLIKHADIAMYQAKREGKNNYQFFTEEMNRIAIERLTVENSIRQALSQGSFKLFYQPKVDANTLELTGFEALIRWEDPKAGYVLPVNFIAVAEESGLILELGEWILRETCQQITFWQSLNPLVKIAVNLSGRQFQDRDLVNKIMSVLKEHNVEPKNIEFEITESTLMNDMDYTMNTLAELSRIGFSLSLDDFGTGYSSLRYLQLFPVHNLKIDQSFVRDINTDNDDANIVSTIIKMAHSLNLSVVVEGVESIEQLEFIRAEGGEIIQGYLFSQPVNAEVATELVKKRFFTLNTNN